jgi:hypothetical protein
MFASGRYVACMSKLGVAPWAGVTDLTSQASIAAALIPLVLREKLYDFGLIRKLKPYCSKIALAADERKKLRYRVTAGFGVVALAATG